MKLDGTNQPSAPTGEHWDLRLYVAGQSPKSLRAAANLRNLCEEHLRGRYEIQIIDLAVDPSLARIEDIVATPTLIRRLPPPLRRFVGDLSDNERLVADLRS